jgi:alpha-tubulin suppressor-like RCC1 family protein
VFWTAIGHALSANKGAAECSVFQMNTRAFAAIGTLGSLWLAACVGDAPSGLPIVVPDASGTDAGTIDSGTTEDATVRDASQVDGGTDANDADTSDAMPQRPVLAIGASGTAFHTCAVLANGGISCWGLNDGKQIGDGTTAPAFIAKPVANIPAGVSFTQVAPGRYHTCARASSGAVYCWGANGTGALGDGTTTQQPNPTRVLSINNAAAVTANFESTCALDGDVAKCWGADAYGALGRPTAGDRAFPMPVLEDGTTATKPMSGVSSLAMGNLFGCSVRSGSVACWGWNHIGQTGAGAAAAPCGAACGSIIPVAPSGLGANVKLVRSSFLHSCAVTQSGAVFCWGYAPEGRLGAAGGPTPVSVILQGLTITDVAPGGVHTCALTTVGEVYCWGRNAEGQTGQVASAFINPTKVPGLTDVIQVVRSAQAVKCSVGAQIQRKSAV